VLDKDQPTYENEQAQTQESVADFFPTLHHRTQSVAHSQHGTVQFWRQLEPDARARAGTTVRQMRTAQHELPGIHETPRKSAHMWIDVNTDCQSIVVDAPVAEVYRRCLRFQDFPRFITSIRKIEQINETHFSCTSIVNGQEVKTVVTIMMRVPDRRITWQWIFDNFQVGVVSFDPLPGGATKVTVKVRSVLEPVMLTGSLRHYLRNFKVYIENDGQGK